MQLTLSMLPRVLLALALGSLVACSDDTSSNDIGSLTDGADAEPLDARPSDAGAQDADMFDAGDDAGGVIADVGFDAGADTGFDGDVPDSDGSVTDIGVLDTGTLDGGALDCRSGCGGRVVLSVAGGSVYSFEDGLPNQSRTGLACTTLPGSNLLITVARFERCDPDPTASQVPSAFATLTIPATIAAPGTYELPVGGAMNGGVSANVIVEHVGTSVDSIWTLPSTGTVTLSLTSIGRQVGQITAGSIVMPLRSPVGTASATVDFDALIQ